MRVNPEIKLPVDTPERMVAIFKSEYHMASPEMQTVLDSLINKWTGWHGTTFRFLHTDGYGVGMKVQNWDELYRMCVFV